MNIKTSENKMHVIHPDWTDTLALNGDILEKQTGGYAKILNFSKSKATYLIQRFDNNKKEYLYYNKVSDNWWCYPVNKLKPVINNGKVDSKISCIIISLKAKFINFAISKNCNSTILANAMNIDQNLTLTSKDMPWYHAQGEKTLRNTWEYSSYFENKAKYAKFKKFFVYRDPIERFVNLANYMYTGRNKDIGVPFINHSLDKKDFIDELIKLIEIYSLNDDKSVGDPHLTSQARTLFRITPNDVDDMVLVKDLNYYLINELHIKNPVHSNKSPVHEISASDLTYEQRNRITEIWSDDYDLYKTYANKIYIPPVKDEKRLKYPNTFLVIKSIGYRLFGTLATILISFIFTGNISISLSIGFFEVLSKIILYVVYEKLWEKIIKKIKKVQYREKNM